MTRHDDPDTTTPIDTTAGEAPVERSSFENDQTVPLYAMLDVFMALGGDPGAFDAWYGPLGYADAWATLCQHVRDLAHQNAPAVPARVSTPAELDALPSYTVVICQTGEAWQRGNPMAEGWHLAGGDIADYGDEDLIRSLPAAIVYRPDRDPLAEARAEVAELREQRDQATVALAEAPGFMSVWREAEARGVERARVDLAAQVAQAEATLIAEAEARGVARGRGEALTEAADDLDRRLRDLPHGGRHTRAGWAVNVLRARAAETPGGAA